jgi:hypothetical protein
VSTASGVRFDWRARETFAQVQVPMSIGGDDAIWDGEWHLVAGVVDGATGNVEILVDGVRDSGSWMSGTWTVGYAGASTAGMTIGSYPATCPGMTPFAGSVDEVRVYDRVLSRDEIGSLMPSVPTSMPPLTQPSASSVWGTSFEFSYEITPAPKAGTLELWDDYGGVNTRIFAGEVPWPFPGTGTITTPSRFSGTEPYGVGTHHLTMRYIGGPPWESSQPVAALDHVVTKRTTAVAVSSGPNPSIPGEPVAVTAAVTDYVTGGSVSFWKVVGGVATKVKTLTLGGTEWDETRTATWTPIDLPLGTTELYATYNGSPYEKTAKSPSIFHRVAKLPTTSQVLFFDSQFETNHPIQLIGIVAPNTATGLVTFYDTYKASTTTLGSAPATPYYAFSEALIEVPSLAAGTHKISIQYAGDSKHLSSTSGLYEIVVTPDIVHVTDVHVGDGNTKFYPIVDGYRDTITARGYLAERAKVVVSVVNTVTGAAVRTMDLGWRPIGPYASAWNGRSTDGALAPAGAYTLIQSFRDEAGVEAVLREGLIVSHEKLVLHTYTQTIAAGSFVESAKTGSATISKAGSSYSGGVRINSGGSTGSLAWVAYDFTVPRSITQTSLTFAVRGRGSLTAPAGSFLEVFNGRTGTYDSFEAIGGDYDWYSTSATPREHIYGRGLVRGLILVRNPGIAAWFDARDVVIKYTYSSLE